MRPVVVFAFVWIIGGLLHAGQQQMECLHDEACPLGECRVWESSRFVCEPETYSVMVFPAKCILKNAITPESRLEIRLDANGELDKKTARVFNTQIEYKIDCGHIEIRKRNVN